MAWHCPERSTDLVLSLRDLVIDSAICMTSSRNLSMALNLFPFISDPIKTLLLSS